MPPYLFLFAAGILIGKKWDAIKSAIKPLTGDASARFDELYSDAARKVGSKVEDLEDRAKEKRFHSSRVNGF
jgi:hypothetical protein